MLVLHLQAAVTEALDVRLEALALLEKIVDVGEILLRKPCTLTPQARHPTPQTLT
jgi:hypothetical protein